MNIQIAILINMLLLKIHSKNVNKGNQLHKHEYRLLQQTPYKGDEIVQVGRGKTRESEDL